MSRKTSWIRIGLIAPLLALGACASTFNSDVARFYQAPLPQGLSFNIVPLDQTKQGSLEFRQYAGLVSARLVQLGYRPVADGQTADVDVRLDYGVSPGREKIQSYPGFGGFGYPYGYGYGGFGYGFRSHYYGGFGYPYGYGGFGYPYGLGGFGYGPEITSTTIYTRGLTLDIVRAGQPTQKLFEGRVSSVGSDPRLPEVVPYLVDSLFKNFPGKSGATEQIKLPIASRRG